MAKESTQDYRLDRLDETVNSHGNKLDLIMTNHLPHLQKGIDELKEPLGITKNNVDWLLRFFWIIATAAVGGLIASILNLIL